MTLRERLLKALEFKNVDGNNHDFERGRQTAYASRREIDLALADVVEALEDALDAIDMGLGLLPSSPETSKLISARAKLEEVLKEMGK